MSSFHHRVSIFVAGAFALAIAPAVARADVAAVYVQARGMAGAERTKELPPGGDEPAFGTALGYRLGGRVLFLEGFVDRHQFGGDASMTRGVLGFHGGVELGELRLRGSAGVGALRSTGGALDMTVPNAAGPMARAAASLDVSLGYGLWLGFELESAVFRIAGDDASLVDDGANGGVVLGSLQLGLELGL